MYRHPIFLLRTRLLHNYFVGFQAKHTISEEYAIQLSKSDVCKVIALFITLFSKLLEAVCPWLT